MVDQTKGTKEWAKRNMNIYSGCSNNCRYCYAKKEAIRFKRKEAQEWKEMDLNEKKFLQNHNRVKIKEEGLYDYMFPTSHDITIENIEHCISKLWKLLKPGNTVLITTKPHLECVIKILKELRKYKNQVGFMFTITSRSNVKLTFWEPGAPKILDRMQSLQMAFLAGWETNVSIEPFLDKNPVPLILQVFPFVRGKIWLGKMNYIKNAKRLHALEEELTAKDHKRYLFQQKISGLIHLENIIKDLQRLPDKVKEKIKLKDSIVNAYKKAGWGGPRL